ncbi:MAG: DUF1549 domain-containing protein, partial [Isosphaeraceae bacterium]
MHARSSLSRIPASTLTALVLTISPLLLTSAGLAGAATNPASAEISVEPKTFHLAGRRTTQQMIATQRGTDGMVSDATRSVEWVVKDPRIATVTSRGRVVPRANGSTTVVARLGRVDVVSSLTVDGMDGPCPVSFRRDVIPAFSQAGCNMGACHGTPTGKGGFRLSLRGYLPDQDFTILSREAGGRRINPMAAETSLILRKPLGEVPHEGGLRLSRTTKTYEFLHDWIAEGARDDPGGPKPVRLEILPEPRVLVAPASTQQLMVRVYDESGASRDITPICYYDSSNPEIAEVDAEGYVKFKTRGEVAVIAHYLNLVANVRLTHLVEVPGFARVEVPRDNVVDRAVFAKLNRMRIRPSERCTDREFIRRAYLDVIGVLPRAEEVDQFLAWPEKERRARLVDALLNRSEFADFWALKFADILRSNGRLIESKGAYVFHRWIHDCIQRDMPLDEFVRELLTAEGSTFKNPAANYYRVSRDPESAVETTAQLFLGVRIQCAKCHNHPFERWTQDDYYGFAAFFSQVGRKKGNLPD